MEPQGRGSVPAFRTRRRNRALGLRKTTLRSRVHVQTVGLNAETKKDRHRAGRGGFSLDIPFYRTSPAMPFANLPDEHPSRWGETLTVEKMKECVWLRPEA